MSAPGGRACCSPSQTARPQVVLQVSVLHQLHQDEGGLALTDHPEQLDDVLRVVVLHHAGLVQELNPLPVAGLLIDGLDGARYFTLQVRNITSVLQLTSLLVRLTFTG